MFCKDLKVRFSTLSICWSGVRGLLNVCPEVPHEAGALFLDLMYVPIKVVHWQFRDKVSFMYTQILEPQKWLPETFLDANKCMHVENIQTLQVRQQILASVISPFVLKMWLFCFGFFFSFVAWYGDTSPSFQPLNGWDKSDFFCESCAAASVLFGFLPLCLV